jgi:hypothetical protein
MLKLVAWHLVRFVLDIRMYKKVKIWKHCLKEPLVHQLLLLPDDQNMKESD